MRTVTTILLVVSCAVPAVGQALTQVAAPEFVPVIQKVPLQADLSVSVEWIPLGGRSMQRLYTCTVAEVTDDSVTYQTAHNNVMHTIQDRVTSEHYTGDWSETQDDTLPHTWPWIPLVAAQELHRGQVGETKVKLGDLLARETREYLFVGTGMTPLMSEGQPVMALCWVLVCGSGSSMSVLADADNPLVIESHEPGVSMQRVLEISGPDIEFGAPEQ